MKWIDEAAYACARVLTKRYSMTVYVAVDSPGYSIPVAHCRATGCSSAALINNAHQMLGNRQAGSRPGSG